MASTDPSFADRPLEIPVAIIAQIVAHAEREQPRECCGLLSGRLDVVETIHPLVNEAADDAEFEVGPGLIEPMKKIREAGEELLAIYHSHPSSEALPSKKDLERNHYPDVVQLIVSLAEEEPVLRAFVLEGEDFVEVRWKSGPRS